MFVYFYCLTSNHSFFLTNNKNCRVLQTRLVRNKNKLAHVTFKVQLQKEWLKEEEIECLNSCVSTVVFYVLFVSGGTFFHIPISVSWNFSQFFHKFQNFFVSFVSSNLISDFIIFIVLIFRGLFSLFFIHNLYFYLFFTQKNKS